MRQVSWIVIGILLAGAAEAAGQPAEPIGPYVVNVRGALARFKAEAPVAEPLEVRIENLPTRGLGISGGAHWYPLRRGRVTLGVGAEVTLARDSRTGEETTPGPPPVTVTTRFSTVSPQLSLNFGTDDGWSYISGGIGQARLTTVRADLPAGESAARVRSTNYGGGARWFTSPRLAFTFDVRFYTVNAREPTATRPGYPRSRFMVISAGISVR